MADHNAKASDLVQLNIGGERLVTVSRSTLTENGGDSMLAAMFSGRHKLKTDDQVRTLNALLSSALVHRRRRVRFYAECSRVSQIVRYANWPRAQASVSVDFLTASGQSSGVHVHL